MFNTKLKLEIARLNLSNNLLRADIANVTGYNLKLSERNAALDKGMTEAHDSVKRALKAITTLKAKYDYLYSESLQAHKDIADKMGVNDV